MAFKLVALCALISLALGVPYLKTEGGAADTCVIESCKIEKNCRCSSAPSPIPVDSLDKYPQLISITFTDSVSPTLKNLINELIGDRANPDHGPMLATIFVPHEFTNYQTVNELYNFQYEIGVHSITRNNLQEYWRNASTDVLEQEFGGQRTIIAKFANIPIQEVIGARTPQYQLNGNDSIKAFIKAGLVYDNTWPTNPSNLLFPYTLDYMSTQECLLGSDCPNEAFPGFWMLPINDFNGAKGDCNNLGACKIQGTAEDISGWMIDEVNRMKESKVPITMSVDTNYFTSVKNSKEAFKIFLDEMQKQKDVFFVAQSQVLSWMKNPVDLTKFKTAYNRDKALARCLKKTCQYKDALNQHLKINMLSCAKCPPKYPWLGNPYGQ